MTKKISILLIASVIIISGCEKKVDYDIKIDDTYNRLSKIITLKPYKTKNKASKEFFLKNEFTRYEAKYPPTSIYYVIDTSYLKPMKNVYLFNRNGDLCSMNIAFYSKDAFLKLKNSLVNVQDKITHLEDQDFIGITARLGEERKPAQIILSYSKKEDAALLYFISLDKACIPKK